MPELTRSESIVVARPPEAVYELVSDVTRTGEWSPVCAACWWDEGAGPRVGSWFTGRNETPERVWQTRSQVVVAEPGREFTWMVGDGLARWSYTLEPAPEGTRLTESWAFLPAGLALFDQRYGDRAGAGSRSARRPHAPASPRRCAPSGRSPSGRAEPTEAYARAPAPGRGAVHLSTAGPGGGLRARAAVDFEQQFEGEGSAMEAEWAVPGVPRPAAPPTVTAPVLVLRQVVREVLAAPAVGAPQDLTVLLGVVEQLRGRVLRELAELDVSGRFGDEAASAAAWLRRRQHLGDDTARATVRLAGRLRQDLPELLTGLEAGDTTVEHVRAVAAGVAGLDADLVAQAQPALLALAQAAEPAVVRRQLRERAEAISPELARDADRRQRDRQGFYADSTSGSGVLLGGQLAAEEGAVLLHGLDLCVEADRTAGDRRTLPARRAAVLVDWARTAAATSSSSGGQDVSGLRTQLLITCTPEQLAATASQHALAALQQPGALPGTPALHGAPPHSPCSPAPAPTPPPG